MTTRAALGAIRCVHVEGLDEGEATVRLEAAGGVIDLPVTVSD